MVSSGTLLYNHKTFGLVRVIKDIEKNAILKGWHTDTASGHQGINRTTLKEKEPYYWPGWKMT